MNMIPRLPRPSRARRRARFALGLECLEDRTVPAITLSPVANGMIAPVEGSAFNGIVATFTDSNAGAAAGDFSAVIAWGDGSQSPANGQAVTVVADPNTAGQFDVRGMHAYAEDGSYTVGVTVT